MRRADWPARSLGRIGVPRRAYMQDWALAPFVRAAISITTINLCADRTAAACQIGEDDPMVDISQLNDAGQLRELMKNARRLGDDRSYWAAFKQVCEVQARAHREPLEKDLHRMLAGYEELLAAQHGRRVAATRTRQKLANKGVETPTALLSQPPRLTLRTNLLSRCRHFRLEPLRWHRG